jgi:hypothetical protein
MKLGRILMTGPDGPVVRLVAVHPERSLVIDLARAEQIRRMRSGATAEAARRLAAVVFPSSMSQAIAL